LSFIVKKSDGEWHQELGKRLKWYWEVDKGGRFEVHIVSHCWMILDE
jgi:hypothetical protein